MLCLRSGKWCEIVVRQRLIVNVEKKGISQSDCKKSLRQSMVRLTCGLLSCTRFSSSVILLRRRQALVYIKIIVRGWPAVRGLLDDGGLYSGLSAALMVD